MIDEILAAPDDDDDARLVWADAIGGERGELVVLQCGERSLERRDRERALISRNGLAWSGVGDLVDRVTYDRGFPVAIEVDLALLAEHVDDLLARAPLVTAFSVTGITHAIDPVTRAVIPPRPAAETVALVEQLLGNAAFTARVQAIELVDPVAGTPDSIAALDDVARALGRWRIPDHLATLGLRGRAWYDAGPVELMATALAHAPKVAKLALRDHRLGDEDVAYAAQILDGLVAIDLTHRTGPVLDATRLGGLFDKPLVALALSGITPQGLWTLANSRASATLEHLTLERADLGIGRIALLDMFPRLRSIDLGVQHDLFGELAQLSPASLRAVEELHVASYASPETIAAIRARFGARIVVDPAPADPPILRPPGPRADRRIPIIGPRETITDEKTQRTWELPRTEVVRLGRGQDADVLILDPMWSRLHAVLTWRGDHHELRNVGDNGTWVDGVLATKAIALRDGAAITVADRIRLRYRRLQA